MIIRYLPAADREYKEKLARIALRPFTTHSIKDFIEDIVRLEAGILAHPGLRPIRGASAGWFRVGPSRIYSYSLVYRLREGEGIVVATAAPSRHPFYWRRRRF